MPRKTTTASPWDDILRKMADKDGVMGQQVGGDHYRKMGVFQPWNVLAKWLTPDELRGFMKGTAIVYLARERDKGGDEDVLKALHTIQLWDKVRR